MTSLFSETRIAFGKLARREGVHLSTVWRWALRGCKGHVLESFSLGGKRFTTIEAFGRWIAAVNGDLSQPAETPHQREQSISRAEKRARELGV